MSYGYTMKSALKTSIFISLFFFCVLFAWGDDNSDMGQAVHFDTGITIQPENKFLFDRFEDFTYLRYTTDYIYYSDSQRPGEEYRIKYDPDHIYASEMHIQSNPTSIFSHKKYISGYYFDSGEYLPVFKPLRSLQVESFSSFRNTNNENTSNSDIIEVNLQLDETSLQEVIQVKGNIVLYDEYYAYYRNDNDNFALYRFSKDGSSQGDGERIGASGNPYFYIEGTDDEYIYYRNADDEYRLYRIKKDGSQQFGTKIINSKFANTYHVDDNYVYYRNSDQQNSIFRAAKDGSDILNGGIKISDFTGSPSFFDSLYLYYEPSIGELYRQSLDGTHVDNLGQLVLNFGPLPLFNDVFIDYDNEFLYYLKKDEVIPTDTHIYKAKLNGEDANEEGNLIGGTLLVDSYKPLYKDGYIYYHNSDDQNRIYRISVDEYSVGSSGQKISNNENTSLQFIDDEYIYFNEFSYKPGRLLRVKKDGSQLNTNPEVLDTTEVYRQFVHDNDELILWGAFNQDTQKYIWYNRNKNGGLIYFPLVQDYESSRIAIGSDTDFIDLTVNADIPEGTEYKFYIRGDNTDYQLIENSLLHGNTELAVQDLSVFGSPATGIFFKIELFGNRDNQTVTPRITSVEIEQVQRSTQVIDYFSPADNNTEDAIDLNALSGIYSIDYEDKTVNLQENSGTANSEIQNAQSSGDPVRLETGEFEYDNTLMYVPSEGMPFSFDLTYRNQAYYNGPAGHNWDFNFNMYLREDTAGNVYFHDGKLGVYTFTKNEDDTFAYNTLLDGALTRSGSTSQILLDGKMQYTFGENTKISELKDEHGNTMKFSYSGAQLLSITDTQGREYSLEYYENQRIQSLIDFNGNKVDFNYYGSGETLGGENDLREIVIVNSGEEKTISFEYTLSEDYVDAHNITKLIDSKGQTYVENSYENDRVITQVFGNGSINYNYTLSGSSVIGNEITDRNGNITSYEFDERGNTLSRSKAGETYSFHYDEKSKLIKEILPRGNGFTYSYDENGNLIEKRQKQDVNAPDSADDIVTSYTYDLLYNTPTSMTLPNGLTTSYELDERGNIISTTSSAIDSGSGEVVQETSFSYDDIGRIVSSTDSYGVITEFVYSGSLLVSQTRGGVQTESYSYDDYGNILSKTDALGNTTSYAYDEFYNMVTQTSPEGITTRYSYDANNNRLSVSVDLESGQATTTTSYEILDKPESISQEISESESANTQMSYDANENLLETIFPNGAREERSYDAYDRLTEKRLYADGTIDITAYSYDDNGNLVSQDRNGKITTTDYDLFDRPILVTDALGNTLSYRYDKVGNVVETQSKDQSGTVLSHSEAVYNALNLPLSQTQHDGDDTRSTYYSYDSSGNMLSLTDARGNTTSYSYDALMRQSQVQDVNGLLIQNQYDLKDRLIAKSVVSTNPVKTITTSYVYDADDRLISQSDALGNTTLYSYNTLGQQVSETDANGIITHYEYDYRNKRIKESREGREIRYHYDAMGNMIQLTDANGNITQYLYNKKRNRIKEIHNDGTQYIFHYDLEGKITSELEPNGNTRSYVYDDLNRVITKNISGTGTITGVTQENFSYDGLGRMKAADNDLGININFSYNLFGDLISESQTTPFGGTQIVSYDHDALGNTTGITYPDASLLTRNYDATSRLTNISLNNEDVININYNDLYKISQTYGNSRIINYGYDSLGRLENLNSKVYSYDPLGNILSDGDDSYQYDTHNRLESLTYGSTPWENYTGRSYQYDLMGNRVQENLYYKNSRGKTKNRPVLYDVNTGNASTYRAYKKDIISDYGSVQNWESRDGVEHTRGKHDYDVNGRLKRKVVNEKWSYIYHYDGNNRLIQVDKESHIAGQEPYSTLLTSYQYDPLGRRVQKQGYAGRTTMYSYAGEHAIQERVYGSGSTSPFFQKSLIYSDTTDDLIATRNTVLSSGDTKTYYYEKDHLGSIESVYDEASGLVEYYEYDVFGNVISRDSTGARQKIQNAESMNTRLYTGREYDQEIGFYYNRARYYDPLMGKFISRDPIGITDDINLYSYVANSPVVYVDRMGTEKILIAYGNNFSRFGFRNDAIGKAVNFEIQTLLDSGVNPFFIYQMQINSKKDFENALASNEFSRLVIIAHGAKEKIKFSEEYTLTKEGIKDLDLIGGICGNQTIKIVSCNTGKGTNSIAELLSKSIDRDISAPNGFVLIKDDIQTVGSGFFTFFDLSDPRGKFIDFNN